MGTLIHHDTAPQLEPMLMTLWFRFWFPPSFVFCLLKYQGAQQSKLETIF